MRLAPWPSRLFVTALLVTVGVCGTLSIEAWPMTGWRLFSTERQRIDRGWRAVSVDAQGRETPVDFARFGSTYRFFNRTMTGFATLSRARQQTTCRTWRRIVRQRGGRVEGGLRLYATTRDMGRHIGRRAPVVARATLMWTCTERHGARGAGARGAGARGAGARGAGARGLAAGRAR